MMLILAALMSIVGLAMLREPPERDPATQCRTSPCIGIGTAVGVLTGFLGVGGGFLIVPALVLFAGIETRAAIGTSRDDHRRLPPTVSYIRTSREMTRAEVVDRAVRA